ncbi:hypothetical protein D9615_001181 [Tricholomella constricta]|uniref:Uncharacterized protein n=1 Tax=Tricholomella constricta TaxID=117010 RepID=A0A8H5HKM3_9AGAR|nr:hypothetical protein D9615_001181 [Tricholomella constricta]
MSASHSILLSPRPYAQFSGKLLLLPLLPSPKPLKPLPTEIWSEIVAYVLLFEGTTGVAGTLLRICKGFTRIALPLVYACVTIPTFVSLERFQQRLHSAEQKWDSIRRIPYSTPGRWVQALDLSKLAFSGQAQALQFDSILTKLFPLVPFLAHLSMNPSFVLSRRAMVALGERDGAINLRSLEGISYIPGRMALWEYDPLLQLLRQCVNLEEFDVIGQGPDPAELEFTFQDSDDLPPGSFRPLHLPNLHTITLLSMHSSPLMMALLFSPLPSLRKITLTPYDDIPYPSSLVSQFISVHGETLRSLLLFTPKAWPTRLHPSPSTLLETCPNLRHLSLENPLPPLNFSGHHSLQIISIPRPNDSFWRGLEKILPQLPRLSVLRTRDVRWLRKGMNTIAQGAGVQGEMKEWRKRLGRNGIRLVDADWSDIKE